MLRRHYFLHHLHRILWNEVSFTDFLLSVVHLNGLCLCVLQTSSLDSAGAPDMTRFSTRPLFLFFRDCRKCSKSWCVRVNTHTHTHAHAHTHTLMCAHTHTHHTHTRTHARAHTRTARTHARTHAHTHTHVCTHKIWAPKISSDFVC